MNPPAEIWKVVKEEIFSDCKVVDKALAARSGHRPFRLLSYWLAHKARRPTASLPGQPSEARQRYCAGALADAVLTDQRMDFTGSQIEIHIDQHRPRVRLALRFQEGSHI